MAETEREIVICSASRRDRTITFTLREPFGSGVIGFDLAPDTSEKAQELCGILMDAVFHILRPDALVEVTRWVELEERILAVELAQRA